MLRKIMIALSTAAALGVASAAVAMPEKPCIQPYDGSGVPVAPYCR
jgi:hypothetical protein